MLSSSHCVAKSALARPGARHICYCHTPMRYAWDQFDSYFGPDQVGRAASAVLRPVLARLARWDAATAGRVDRYMANSHYVAERIRRYYNRGSAVVYPPVDTAFYRPDPARSPEPFFLVVSALVPYKRVDVAIRACGSAGVALRIVGKGPEELRLRRIAETAGVNVEFAGWLAEKQVRALYQGSRAVLMPGIEDFGIVPVEAQACGRPVVALAEGGAVESVVDGITGVLVGDRSVEAFATALRDVSSRPFDGAAIRRHAESFSKARFQEQFRQVIDTDRNSDTRGTNNDPREIGAKPPINPGDRSNAARYRQRRYNPAARENK